jgi:hypothetical protein
MVLLHFPELHLFVAFQYERLITFDCSPNFAELRLSNHFSNEVPTDKLLTINYVLHEWRDLHFIDN